MDPFCHSGLEPESMDLKLDSRFRGNDSYETACMQFLLSSGVFNGIIYEPYPLKTGKFRRARDENPDKSG